MAAVVRSEVKQAEVLTRNPVDDVTLDFPIYISTSPILHMVTAARDEFTATI
jgi:hypothetical protein